MSYKGFELRDVHYGIVHTLSLEETRLYSILLLVNDPSFMIHCPPMHDVAGL